jgi:hypothetical protein
MNLHHAHPLMPRIAVGVAVAAHGVASAQSDQKEPDLGVNIFGLSVHANRSKDFNEINPGVGLRYVFARPAPRWRFFGEGGIYYDSSREWAKYLALGAAYRFAEHWSVAAGVAYGQSASYNNGKPFFALVPGLAFEYRDISFNAVLLPSENSVTGVGFYVTIPLRGWPQK